jgi:hypothetical protein
LLKKPFFPVDEILKESVHRKFFCAMKPGFPILAAVFVAFSAPQTHAQTLNWGVPVGEQLKDSNGDAIDDSYVFELGAFPLNFNHDEVDVGEWLTHWKVFDALTYDPVFGFTTSSVFILSDVKSNSTKPGVSTESFAGLNAYIWVRKGDQPVAGSEWFVGRAIDWTFPTAADPCCPPSTTKEWSVSDLGPGETPEWGRQNDLPGRGESTFTGPLNGLQTHTFIPEPSSSLLLIFGAAGLVLARRRSALEG